MNRRRDAAKKVHCTIVKFPSLLTDRNQIYTNCGACAVCDMFTVSLGFLEYKAKCCEEGALYFQ
jgi:hypothetical protein